MEHQCHQTEKINEHHATLNGNGKPGLKSQMAILWAEHEDRKDMMRSLRNAIIAGVIVQLLSILGWAWLTMNAAGQMAGK